MAIKGLKIAAIHQSRAGKRQRDRQAGIAVRFVHHIRRLQQNASSHPAYAADLAREVQGGGGGRNECSYTQTPPPVLAVSTTDGYDHVLLYPCQTYTSRLRGHNVNLPAISASWQKAHMNCGILQCRQHCSRLLHTSNVQSLGTRGHYLSDTV